MCLPSSAAVKINKTVLIAPELRQYIRQYKGTGLGRVGGGGGAGGVAGGGVRTRLVLHLLQTVTLLYSVIVLYTFEQDSGGECGAGGGGECGAGGGGECGAGGGGECGAGGGGECGAGSGDGCVLGF